MNLLTARDLQDLLDVDKSTVYRMAGDGRLPAIKVGRQWRFPADSIEAMFGGAIAGAAPSEGRSPGLDLAVCAEIVDLVAASLGVMMVVTDVVGAPLTPIARPVPRLAGREPGILEECVSEWRALADDPDLVPRFRVGPLGFECARAFVRSGPSLVGMVLAGGIAAADDDAADLYRLDADRRRLVLDLLPRTAALIARVAVLSDRRTR